MRLEEDVVVRRTDCALGKASNRLLLEAETIFGIEIAVLYAIESSRNITHAVNASHRPRRAKLSVIMAKRDYRGLLYLRDPEKFP